MAEVALRRSAHDVRPRDLVSIRDGLPPLTPRPVAGNERSRGQSSASGTWSSAPTPPTCKGGGLSPLPLASASARRLCDDLVILDRLVQRGSGPSESVVCTRSSPGNFRYGRRFHDLVRCQFHMAVLGADALPCAELPGGDVLSVSCAPAALSLAMNSLHRCEIPSREGGAVFVTGQFTPGRWTAHAFQRKEGDGGGWRSARL